MSILSWKGLTAMPYAKDALEGVVSHAKDAMRSEDATLEASLMVPA